jgi:hypothetical protein
MSARTMAAEAELRDALAVATTWEEFGKGLQKFRKTWPWLSLRVMERRPDCLSRSAISARETGKFPFTEQELRDYLHACKATDDLIDYCITQHRRITAHSLRATNPQAPPTWQRPSPPSTTGSVVLEIPDPDAEIERLRHKASSHGESGEPLKAANIAAEAVTMSETIYGLEHPTTLHARRQQLWWASEAFAQSCRSLLKQRYPSRRERRRQEEEAADLRRSWETLIGSFRQVYGRSHRETLRVRRWYADRIRKNGLGNYELYKEILIDAIADAEYSLGRRDNFTLNMRWELAESAASNGDRYAWLKLAHQLAAEFGCGHSIVGDAMYKTGLFESWLSTKNLPKLPD